MKKHIQNLIGLKVASIDEFGQVVLENGMTLLTTYDTDVKLRAFDKKEKAQQSGKPVNLTTFLRSLGLLSAMCIDKRKDHYRLKGYGTVDKTTLNLIRSFNKEQIIECNVETEIQRHRGNRTITRLVLRTKTSPAKVFKNETSK